MIMGVLSIFPPHFYPPPRDNTSMKKNIWYVVEKVNPNSY